MAINFTDFSNVAPLRRNKPDFFEQVMKGYQYARTPKEIRQREEKQQLLNEYQKFVNQTAPEKFQSEQDLSKAQAAHYNNPLTYLTGTPKEYAELDYLQNQFGEDSDIYQGAKDKLNLDKDAIRNLIDTRKSQNALRPKQAASGLVTLQLEQEEAKAGFLPGSNYSIPIDEEQQAQKLDEIDRKITKEVTDENARTRYLKIQDIEQVLDKVNSKDLAKFSGLPNIIKQAITTGKGAFNFNSEKELKDYTDYQNAVAAATLAAEKVVGGLGTSVAEANVRRMKELMTPQAWYKPAKVVEDQFNFMRDLIKDEGKIYKKAAKAKDVDMSNLNFDNPTHRTKNTYHPNYSDEDLEYTAMEEGIPVEDVLRQLEAQNAR